MNESADIKSLSHGEEGSQEYNDSKNYVDTSEANNAMNRSAIIESGFINIEDDVDANEANNVMNRSAPFIGFIDTKEEQYEYSEHVQEQNKYLLGQLGEGYTLELGQLGEGYTLEQLCKDISENQRYLFSKDQETVEQPSNMFQIDDQGCFVVPFQSNNVWYRPSSCYKMSNDKKVLYERDKEGIFSATYYDDENNVYFTVDKEVVKSLLSEHKVEFGDDVSNNNKNNILNKINNNEQKNINNNNNIPNQQNQSNNMNENDNNNLFGQNNNNQINQDKNNNSKNDKFNNNKIIFNKNLNKDLQLNKCIVTNVNSDKKVNSDEKFNRKSDNNNNQNQFPENINTKLTYGQQVKPSNNSDRCWNNLKWLDCCGLCCD